MDLGARRLSARGLQRREAGKDAREQRVEGNGGDQRQGEATCRASFAILHRAEVSRRTCISLALDGRRPPQTGTETARLVSIEEYIRAIPDFPIPGILFRDITPLLGDAKGFKEAIDLFVDRFRNEKIDYVVCVEARGYMLGAPLAYAIGAGFVPVRKPGKLPFSKLAESYALEYGTNSLEIHADALSAGHRVVVVDDLLATGGTAAATKRLIERLGAEIVAFAFLIELEALNGRASLADHDVVSFLRYP